MEEYERSYVEDVRRAAMDRINAGNSAERVMDVEPYDTLQITSPRSADEVALTFDDVVLVTMQKTLKNGEKIPTYEVYDKKSRRLLSTDDNGQMKFDKEIFEELIRDKISQIQEKIGAQGLSVAGMDTLDKDGKIESFFELVNGKIAALNKEEKERAKKDPERAKIQEEITDKGLSHSKREELQKGKNVQNMAEKQQIEKDLGIDFHKSTKVDDPIFFENNPSLDRNNTYAGLTADGRLFILENKNGKFEQVKDGFSEPTAATGRTTVIRHDEDNLADNEKNTYGAVYSTRKNNMRYTAELGQYGELKLVQQIRAPKDGSTKMRSETDEWISFEVQTGSTNYLDVNREGMENSENITARTRRTAMAYTDGNINGDSSGKGGLREVSNSMRENKPADFKYEQLAADTNQRVVAAKDVINDVLEDNEDEKFNYIKNQISKDPDAEKAVDERLEDYIEEHDGPFTKEDAEGVLTAAQTELADKEAEKNKNEQAKVNEEEEQKDEEQGRTLEDDALERRLRRRRGTVLIRRKSNDGDRSRILRNKAIPLKSGVAFFVFAFGGRFSFDENQRRGTHPRIKKEKQLSFPVI